MWTIFLLVVLTTGQVHYATLDMEEAGLDNTQVACTQFVQEFKNEMGSNLDANQMVDHWRVGCIQE